MEKKKSLDLKNLARVIAMASPYKVLFYTCIFLGLILGPINVIRPYLIKEMIDESIFQNDNLSSLKNLALFYIFIVLVNAIIRYFFIYWTSLLGQSVIKDLRLRVFKHLTKLKLKYFDNTPIGTAITRTINDVERINDIFTQGSITIIADILMVFVVLGVMFYTSWRLALIFVFTLPLIIIATYIFKEAIKKAYQKVRTQISNMNAFLQERITGMRIVQIFNAEEQELRKFKEINRKYTQANLDSIFHYAVFFPVVELISSLAFACLVWYGTNGIWNQTITPGSFIAFPLFLNMFFRPIRLLADKFNTLQMGLVAAERVFNVLDNKAVMINDGEEKLINLKGGIEFNKVWFAYNNTDYILKDISFSLKEGETLAIIGNTGSGKTTIINLLNRFYSINKGQISIAGKNYVNYDLDNLRSNISIVLQDVFLFSGSVLENISLMDDNISKEKIIEASKQIGAHPFIDSLPGGYDFIITERGSNLSMGQRQLISFVRALVFDPKILILDEATSSVDTETEAIIQYAIEKLIEKRTSIIIAHRLSTIRHANNIMVLDQGKIAEFGTHDSLININDGKYKTLFELQFETEEQMDIKA